MINKIEGWDNLEAKETSNNSLPVGNYIVRIKHVEDVPEKEYFRVNFDITQGQYAGYFTKVATLNNNTWSNQGTKYASYKSSAVQFFRNFITAVEKSNTGYVWNWDEQSLVGKQFVAVYGEEEYKDIEGNIKVGVKLREARSIEALNKGEIKTPQPKKLKAETPNPVVDNSFNAGDLPF